MSSGARNWPFFTFTARPVLPAARSRSVWRQRKAGICKTSATSAAGAHCDASWTSVSTGRPVSAFTLARMRRPSSSPGPRNDLPLVRLALSKLLLKTAGTRWRRATSAMRRACRSVNSSPSITQGPAMTTKEPPPNFTAPLPGVEAGAERAGSRLGHRRARRHHDLLRLLLRRGLRAAALAGALLEGGLDEAGEERVRREGLGLELGV